MSGYRSRRYEHAEPEEPPDLEPDTTDPDVDPPDLRTHDGLDTAAQHAGHEWSARNLTAQQKRDELADL